IMTLARGTITAIGVARRELIAANLAQEGIEVVRNIRDANWLAGRRTDGFGTGGDCAPAASTWRAGLCDSAFNDPYRVVGTSTALDTGPASELLVLRPSQLYEYNLVGAPTPFRREVFIETIDADEMRVRVRVRWCTAPVSSCSNERTLEVEDVLRNWFPS
ncbi:MAG: hypothetical protein HY475_03370, partial [Candidatus Terrybacteria bacterium]|nr:hypothetical protein [Candidatus Terrybacteria bacterium]